ncbi:MAG: galactose mutarotase, partial [Acidobacteria bacterium]|nr:galactose mutarotase [Acidobacteriota bacterium]
MVRRLFIMATLLAVGSTLAPVARAPFGSLPDGTPVELFTLTNARGIEARVMTYGGTLVSLRVPDRQGRLDDVVLGFDTADKYAQKSIPYFGLIGRYGNRIAKGRFTLDGTEHRLATNNGPNHLHGGVRGFDKVMWRGEPVENGVALTYTSRDGEEGYPGTLKVKVTYTLNDRNELAIEYEATTDKPTIVNLTEHSHFNLAGPGTRDVLDHTLQIDADRYTPVDETLIPTGELAPVAGTPFDFRRPTAIGKRIEDTHPQIAIGRGYDHNWVLNRSGSGVQHAARLADPSSGRTMDIATTEPGLQFYSGNFLDGTVTGKQGQVYRRRYG